MGSGKGLLPGNPADYSSPASGSLDAFSIASLQSLGQSESATCGPRWTSETPFEKQCPLNPPKMVTFYRHTVFST